MKIEHTWPTLLGAAATLLFTVSTAIAEDRVWHVSKATGDVWISGPGLEAAALEQTTTLKSGEEIRTGKTGRVLLTRGEETILISPNSVLGVPAETENGLSTVLFQKAGEIVLQVEKKNAPHFEVETPYLAALVKGTHFRVTVNGAGSKVDVIEGKVQVSNFKSGQFALVLPGQTAKVPFNARGMTLSGSGTLGIIEKGAPKVSPVERIQVPRTGLSAPRPTTAGGVQKVPATDVPATPSDKTKAVKSAGVRINAPLGSVAVDVNTATNGLAHSGQSSAGTDRGSKPGSSATVWTSNGLGLGASTGVGYAGSSGSSGSGGGSNGGSGSSSNSGSSGNSSGTSGSGSNGGGINVGVGSVAGVQVGTGNGVSAGVTVGNVLGVGLGVGNGNSSGHSNNGLHLGVGNGNAYGQNK